MNKVFAKRVFLAEKIPTPSWYTIERADALKHIAPQFPLPVVVKPVGQGSAIGVSLVHAKKAYKKAVATALRYGSTVLVERFVSGRELTVGIVGELVLPIVEIIPDNAFYDFDAKYTPGKSRHVVPASLSKTAQRRINDVALRAFEALGCSGVSRIDIILDRRNTPWVLEVNTLPGMTQTSLLPDAARAVGLSFPDLVLQVIGAALSNN